MLPCFMPVSHKKNAAPTGPRPRRNSASQAVPLAGGVQLSKRRWQANDKAAVAKHGSASLSLGVFATRRESTE
jgi:hypothetical protein